MSQHSPADRGLHSGRADLDFLAAEWPDLIPEGHFEETLIGRCGRRLISFDDAREFFAIF